MCARLRLQRHGQRSQGFSGFSCRDRAFTLSRSESLELACSSSGASCASLDQGSAGRVGSALGGGRQQWAHFIPVPSPWLHSLLYYPLYPLKWEMRLLAGTSALD